MEATKRKIGAILGENDERQARGRQARTLVKILQEKFDIAKDEAKRQATEFYVQKWPVKKL